MIVDNRLVKWVYSCECVGNLPKGILKKKWIEPEKGCLVRTNVNLVQARKMEFSSSEWRCIVRGIVVKLANGIKTIMTISQNGSIVLL